MWLLGAKKSNRFWKIPNCFLHVGLSNGISFALSTLGCTDQNINQEIGGVCTILSASVVPEKLKETCCSNRTVVLKKEAIKIQRADYR